MKIYVPITPESQRVFNLFKADSVGCSVDGCCSQLVTIIIMEIADTLAAIDPTCLISSALLLAILSKCMIELRVYGRNNHNACQCPLTR